MKGQLKIYPLLKHIAHKPLDELPSAKVHCPYCNSIKIKKGGKITTLLGGGTGVDDDPNHTWCSCTCNNCTKTFIRETKNGNVWYTEGGNYKGTSVVLKGVPSCFERYYYTHKKCGKRISLEYRNLDDTKDVSNLASSKDENGNWIKSYKTFYSCECGFRLEVDQDHWHGYPYYTVRMSKKQIEENMKKWTFVQSPDIITYASKEAEVELTKIISDQLK